VDPYDFNCTHCVQVYELRRRDVNVEATGLPASLLPSTAGLGGRPLTDVERAWGVSFREASQQQIVDLFDGFGPGARGFVAVLWRFGGGHVFNVENAAGVVRFVDPQTADPDVSHYFELAEWSAYTRTDDASPGSAVLEFAVRESA
jgi:hypothetical protein